MNTKKNASISLDLDNLWSYLKIHGDSGWEEFPSYLDKFVPYALKVLDDFDLKITFFVVGQDAALDKNIKNISMLSENGHEIGNHSFNHESWLHLYPVEKLRDEIFNAEEAIFKATGQRTIGFRGPGFSWSYDLLEVLHERGYKYDASTLPTYIGPLARAYYFWTSNLSKEEKKDRKELFGKFSDGFRSVKPYYHKLKSGNTMLEIPVTTIPMIKIPFHLSYLLYLSSYSISLMKLYLKTAITFCSLSGTSPSFLLHPLDLIGGDEISELKFFPGMNVKSEQKIKIFGIVLEELMAHYNLVNMSSFADEISLDKNLKIKEAAV